ncbi:MAG: cobyrinate a,c-diamide synthase [Beijerinckiaceae bacterium]|nr:cobyrinate a,c-diamide synthase [Beijerinckiaceae bacterium]
MTHGFLVAAPRSGSGKTVLTLGLMRAFAAQGLRVAAAKNGPDYIDPAFHAAATGRPGVNLDTWAMEPGLIEALAGQAARESDLLICEGSMGLFDGVVAAPRRSGASADLAALLGLPVLLVLDISGQSQTAAAIAKGCDGFDPSVRIGGVVLNRVASERHRKLAADAIAAVGLSVVGALPRAETLVLPERHLGLVQAEETPDLDRGLEAIAGFVAAHVDLAAIRALARPIAATSATAIAVPPPGQTIAVARDAAFSFLYPHILSGWRAAGAEIRFFSPLADEPPPEADICWLPGGYPELHAGRLGAAMRFQAGLRAFAQTRPVHGECGGYMVLGQELVDAAGVAHPMVGLLAASFSFAKRKMNLGYRDAALASDCGLGLRGTRLRGHEFHYASVIEPADPDAPFAFARDAQGNPPVAAGSRRGLVTGSFFHVVAAG